MTVRLDTKRPDEKRRYRHDWANFLGDDTIASQTTTSSDVTISAAAIDTGGGSKAIDFTVDGGTDGVIATITQSIVTAAGDHETETFYLPIGADEPITLGDAKAACRVLHNDEDARIAAMIPRARLWVEDYTGLALKQREFVERRRTERGSIRLFKGPLVSLTSVTYGDAQTYAPRAFAPDTQIISAFGMAWPVLDEDDAFEITYVAGYAAKDIDDRLIGAMLALIEGEYTEGPGYPQRAIDAAERCCGFLRAPVL